MLRRKATIKICTQGSPSYMHMAMVQQQALYMQQQALSAAGLQYGGPQVAALHAELHCIAVIRLHGMGHGVMPVIVRRVELQHLAKPCREWR